MTGSETVSTASSRTTLSQYSSLQLIRLLLSSGMHSNEMFLISPNWLILPRKKGTLYSSMRNKRGDSREQLSSILLHYFLSWSIPWKSTHLPKHFEIHVWIKSTEKTLLKVSRGLFWPKCHRRRRMTGAVPCVRGIQTPRDALFVRWRGLCHVPGLKIWKYTWHLA